MDNVSETIEFSIDEVHLIASDLRHEVSIGVFCDTSAPDFPCCYVLEKENVSSSQAGWRHKFIGTEITSSQHILVRIEEQIEIAVHSTIRRREISVPIHDALHRVNADIDFHGPRWQYYDTRAREKASRIQAFSWSFPIVLLKKQTAPEPFCGSEGGLKALLMLLNH